MKTVNAESLEVSIRMLEQFLEADDIAPLLAALRALMAEPESESCFAELVNAFEDVGQMQGAVITYAPYVGILLSDDPFEF